MGALAARSKRICSLGTSSSPFTSVSPLPRQAACWGRGEPECSSLRDCIDQAKTYVFCLPTIPSISAGFQQPHLNRFLPGRSISTVGCLYRVRSRSIPHTVVFRRVRETSTASRLDEILKRHMTLAASSAGLSRPFGVARVSSPHRTPLPPN